MSKAIIDLVVAALPIILLIGFWFVVMRWMAKLQGVTTPVQERLAGAAERQAEALARIADALEAANAARPAGADSNLNAG